MGASPSITLFLLHYRSLYGRSSLLGGCAVRELAFQQSRGRCKSMRFGFGRAQNVIDTAVHHFEVIGNQSAMTLPPKRLGAHNNRAFGRSQLEQMLHTSDKSL